MRPFEAAVTFGMWAAFMRPFEAAVTFGMWGAFMRPRGEANPPDRTFTYLSFNEKTNRV